MQKMMQLIFKYLKLHNFLSYADAEIYLENKHYCLVSGVNNCITDNALSNGIGKSTIGSAIVWALTGETIQGVKNDVKNIYVTDDNCFVQLELSVNNDNYKIVRYKAPKSDLKITLNGEDISGKGIKESETILASRLPDLTVELLASTIILGQGLPLKFTDNTPSGRKEILEKLSKSDFMIQDLKDRITNRNNNLLAQQRAFEDKLLALNTQIDINQKQQQENKDLLQQLHLPDDVDAQIEELKLKLERYKKDKASFLNKRNNLNAKNSDLITFLNNAQESKNNELESEINDFNEFREIYFDKKIKLQSDIINLEGQINNLKNIKDICPTCGQKLPNIVKPSTINEEQKLKELNDELNSINSKFNSAQQQFEQAKKDIENNFNIKNQDILAESAAISNELNELSIQEIGLDQFISSATEKYNSYVFQKNNYNDKLKEVQGKIKALEDSLESLSNEKLYNIEERDIVINRISIINQMNTFIKRDFRGFLLNDIIQFINGRAKIYSKDIFKNDSIEFILNGNNIDINFCGKPFEVLSGGEQQRIDLIIQFSIRDMLQEYLCFSSNILFLDEIFDQLDAIAVDAVLECILKRLCDIDSVFIISHRAGELEIPYDSEILITKNTDGISTLISK